MKPSDLKVGDPVIRTVAFNNPRSNYKMLKAEIKTIKKTTASGYVYIGIDKFKIQDDFPLREWRPKHYGISQYRVHLHADTAENRKLFAKLLDKRK